MYEISARMTNDEDFSFIFYVLDEDDTVPAEFANYAFELVVRHTDTNEEVFVLTEGDGLTASAVDGSVSVFKAAGDHDLYGNYRYSMGCRITYTAGGTVTKQLFTGTLTVIEGNFRD
jgi:hypothetical protein